jgi:hypothetical protein
VVLLRFKFQLLEWKAVPFPRANRSSQQTDNINGL